MKEIDCSSDKTEAQTENCPECGSSDLKHDRKHGHAHCRNCYIVIEQSDLRISQEGGDGSLNSGDAFRDQKKFTESFKTKTETSFKSYNSDNREKYDRLWLYQQGYTVKEGKYVSDDRGIRGYQDKIHVLQCFCNQLHLPEYQQERAKRILNSLESRPFNSVGGLEGMILGVIVVAQNEFIDTPDEFENRIQVRTFNDERDTPKFQRLAKEHNADWTSCMKLVKKQLKADK